MTTTSTGAAGSTAPLPVGLDRGDHIERRRHSPWPRRAAVVLMAAFCALGLANVFGQVASVSRAGAPAATLTVDSPLRLRGGLIFTSVVTVEAHRPINDARLVFSPGWFSGMTLNALAPQSSQDFSTAQGTVFDYGQLDAGATMPLWISWQTNPTTVGARDQDVALYDGATLITAVHRQVVVFP
jgi:hypothetical protein